MAVPRCNAIDASQLGADLLAKVLSGALPPRGTRPPPHLPMPAAQEHQCPPQVIGMNALPRKQDLQQQDLQSTVQSSVHKSVHSSVPGPPPPHRALHDRTKSSQPHHLLDPADSESVRHLFLRKNHTKPPVAPTTPRKDEDVEKMVPQPMQLVQPASVALEIGFTLEENLALRAVQASERMALPPPRQQPRQQLHCLAATSLTATSSPQKPRQSPRHHNPHQPISCRPPISSRVSRSIDQETTRHLGGLRSPELDSTPLRGRFVAVTEEESFGEQDGLGAVSDSIVAKPPLSMHQITPPTSVHQITPPQSPVIVATVILEQLEEAKDRITLESLKQMSANMDAKEAGGRKPAGRILSVIGKVGVLDSTGHTPRETTKEANRRQAFVPNPPLVKKQSILLRQGGEGMLSLGPLSPAATPLAATPRTRAARVMRFEGLATGSNERNGNENDLFNPTAQSRPQTGIVGIRPNESARKARPHTGTSSRALEPQGPRALHVGEFAVSGGSARTENDRSMRGIHSAAQSRPQTGLSAKSARQDAVYDRMQTSWRMPRPNQRPRHPDEIVQAAFVAAFGAHRPCVASIYPSERLGTRSLEGPILQDSKVRDLMEQKIRVQPSPGPLNLNNLVVDWTMPDGISFRSDPIHGRPKSSRFGADSPLQQQQDMKRAMSCSHSSNPALSGVGSGSSRRSIQPFEPEPPPRVQDRRAQTDDPLDAYQHSRGRGSTWRLRSLDSTSRLGSPDVDKTGASDKTRATHNTSRAATSSHRLQADELRPQTCEGSKRLRRDCGAIRGTARDLRQRDLRPVTSHGRQTVRPDAASPKQSLAANPTNSTTGQVQSRLTPTRLTPSSSRSAAALWSDILSEADGSVTGLEHLNKSCEKSEVSAGKSIFEAHRDVSKTNRIQVEKEVNGNKSETGVLSSADLPFPATLDWIGTASYRRYMKDAENLVATSSEKDFVLAQDARVRKMLPQYSKPPQYKAKKRPNSNSFLMSVLKRTTGEVLGTSSIQIESSENKMQEFSRSSGDLKEMPDEKSDHYHDHEGSCLPQHKSVRETLEATKQHNAQVIVDIENYLKEIMHRIKWGDREAPGSEGGLADLIESMDEYDAKVPAKIDWINNEMKPFLKSQMEEKKQQLLLEGRAHAAATLEESKSYVSAFYSNSTERFLDTNTFATKNWEGMTRHEIMKHAEFLRDLAYVKCKSNNLVERITRESRRTVKKSRRNASQRRISRTHGTEEDLKKTPAQPKMKQVSSSNVVNKGFLRVWVHEADNLPKRENKNTADSYVRCEIRTERNEYKRGDKGYVEDTNIVWDSFSPEWGKEFEFGVPSGVDDITLNVSIYDVNLDGYGQQTADTWVGYVQVPIFSGGFQALVAEEQTSAWHTILDAEGMKISSNLSNALGRPSILKLSHVFSRKERMSFSLSAHLLQAAYRCHLARIMFETQRASMQGYRNRLDRIPEVVLRLDQEHYWEHYTRFCQEENAMAVSECKRQFDLQVSFKLVNNYLSFRGVCALSRMFAEIYPPGKLRSLELVNTGINSPGIVALANAIRVGGQALNSLILTGNRITCETNDVSQANHPIKNRLGRGLSGCRAIAQAISEVTTLHRLSLKSCKLGNQGLAEIAKALQTNRCVEFLDVSDTNEAQPVAMQTAATELGKMLSQNDDLVEFHCRDVGFAGNSALAILGGGSFHNSGLHLNGMLRVVDLSRNNLCRTIYANQALRDFLCSDTCFVEHLDLGYNRMNQHGVLVFADGLIGNKSLRHVILDGNELGVVGCRTLLSYRGRKKALGLSSAGLTEHVKMRRPKSKMEVRQIFEKFDCDHSGAMDVKEMKDFLESLSNKDLGSAQSIIETIDKDNSGAIEFDEFYAWYMKTLGIEDDGDTPLEISLQSCSGFTNVKGFDPSDPNGHYRLDMTEPTSRSTLMCMMQLVFAGKAEFLHGTMMRTEEGEDDETARSYTLKIPDDPSEWTTPHDGVLMFEFGMVRPTAGIDDCISSFIFNHLREGFADSALSREERDQLLDTCTGDDAFFRYKQIVELLWILTTESAKHEQRASTLEEERVNLVTRLFLRMVDKNNNLRLLDQLNCEERAQVEAKLGMVAFTFDPNNATGFHKLNLTNPFQREVMMRLIEIRNSQRKDVARWKSHLNRGSSGRDDLELVFRNLQHNGMPFAYTSSWRVPEVGVVEVDFVDVRKPEPQKAVIMDMALFKKELDSVLKHDKRATQRATDIRNVANKEFLTCLQMWKFLRCFDRLKADERRCRVEVAVACFARLVDWRAMRRVYLMEFLPDEWASIEFRLGKANIYFDEVSSPVGYWELDLSDSQDRWITQEIVYLASEEPGYNVIQAKMDSTAAPGSLALDTYRFDGIDFQIPITWLNHVPSNGVVKLFYARQTSVNANYIVFGSWDGKGAPLIKPDKRTFPPDFRVPAIPNNYNEIRDGIEGTWVYIEKIRVIKAALLKVSPSPTKMFNLLDTSGDGGLSRKELTLGLFRIGVWLTPTEAEMLLQVVDVDGSGEVDSEEFEAFWNNAPPFRVGDLEQQSYWTPRRCQEQVFEEMLHFYDIRMSYLAVDTATSAVSSANSRVPSGQQDNLATEEQDESQDLAQEGGLSPIDASEDEEHVTAPQNETEAASPE